MREKNFNIKLALVAVLAAAMLESLGLLLPRSAYLTLLTFPAAPGLWLGFFVAQGATTYSANAMIAVLIAISLLVNGGLYYLLFQLARRLRELWES